MSEQTPTASSVCPICGKDTPHYHSPAEAEQHRETEAWVEESWQQIRPLIFPDAATPTPAPDAVAEGLREIADALADYDAGGEAADTNRRIGNALAAAGFVWDNHARRYNPVAALAASQPVADVRKRDMPGDPDGLGTIALQWYVSFNFAHPHTVRESNVAVEAFKDGYRAASATLTARVETLEGALRYFAAQSTVDEVLHGPDAGRGEWQNASVERRIEMMGQRKRAHDSAILAARAALSPDPAVKPSAEGGAA